jgi:hypothetical protein
LRAKSSNSFACLLRLRCFGAFLFGAEMDLLAPQILGQSDEMLANYLEWEQQDYSETVDTVVEAYADVKAGRTRPAEEFLEELRVKHGFPR